ncbi:hypothetical protein HTZ77_02665 [Nonomuraea sp. SMC257]|uniref:Uncharacterized protein n=1 Tax=Nonomuraea montanisoli TaxID=2741721 RepID=A0A7Y6M0T1_9ACTN|nr:hypothetical protein [Nonomuraea montanisoli]NUW30332.1 hypothetical protein [Nonomuraea montanisoli]
MAKAMISLYPKAWRQRYGEEVADVIDARPARVRTVVDLVVGAADAWLHHRRVPGAGPLRVPLATILACAGAGLLLLWNPGMRDAADLASLHGVWAEAAGRGMLAEQLHGLARLLYATAAAAAVLSVVPLVFTCLTAMRRSGDRVTRITAGRIFVTAVLLAVPVAMIGLGFVGMAFLDIGYPVGPLGEAMVGGFLVPIIMATVLALPMMAMGVPSLGSYVRGTGRILMGAAVTNAAAWLCVVVLLAMGLEQASWSFVGIMAVSAFVSMYMAALVVRNAWGRGRTVLDRLKPA